MNIVNSGASSPSRFEKIVVRAKRGFCSAGRKFRKATDRLPSRSRVESAWKRGKTIKTAAQDGMRAAKSLKLLVVSLLENEVINNIFLAARNANGIVLGSGKGEANRFFSTLNRISSTLNEGLRWTRLLSITSVPFRVFGIAKNGVLIIKGCPGRFDRLMLMIQATGVLLGNVAQFANGLAAVGLVPLASVTFAGPLNLAGSVLRTATQVVKIRSLCQTLIFSHKFDHAVHWQKDGSISGEDFNRTLDFLIVQQNLPKKERDRHLYRLGKHFQFEGRKLNERLKKVRNNSDSLSAQEKVSFIKMLQRRVTIKQVSTSADFLFSAVSFAATPILLIAPVLYPPITPLGFACAAVGSGGAVALFAIDWFTEHRFNKATKRFCAVVDAG